MNNDGFQGGKPMGNLEDIGSSCRARLPNSLKLPERCFNYKEHGSKDAAWKAAENWLRERSDELGITRNKWKIEGDTLFVKLTQGYIMQTDPEALPLVEKYFWCVHVPPHGHTQYAHGNVDDKCLKFHRVYTGFSMVDHIDRNGLNNKRSNLRDVGQKLNQRNRKVNSNNESGCNGVSRRERGERSAWEANWRELDGRHVTRSFSIARWGDEEARRLAIAARKSADARIGVRIHWEP